MNRHRELNQKTYGAGLVVKDYSGSGSFQGQTQYPPTDGMWTGSYRIMDDVVTPNYRKLRSKGVIIMSPCGRSVDSRACTPVQIQFGPHPTWGMRTLSGQIQAYYEAKAIEPAQSDPTSNYVAQLLVEAYAKMNSSAMNSIENTHDLGSTISMLRKPLSGARDLITKMNWKKARRLKKTVNVQKAIADTWLEYRYGWKPLMLDAEEAVRQCHEIRDRLEKRRLVARRYGNKSWEITQSFQATGGGGAPPGASGISGTTSFLTELRVSAGVVYLVAAQNTVDQLNQMLGTRPSDIPVSVWNCIPYSFVVDWFFNVGDWLTAIVPNPAIQVLSNWTASTKTKTKVHTNLQCWNDVATPPAATYRCVLPSTESKYTVYSRNVNVSMPYTPVLLRKPLSATHSADAVSLISQEICSEMIKFNKRR